jgi:hypothetical protein
MLAKTNIETNKKILKMLPQGVQVSLKLQVRPKHIQCLHVFSSRGYIGGLRADHQSYKTYLMKIMYLI